MFTAAPGTLWTSTGWFIVLFLSVNRNCVVIIKLSRVEMTSDVLPFC